MTGKRNISIQLIRVTAMFMIILDHILCNVSFPIQAIIVQMANSGVFIFLFISGYLYGNRNIDNWENWFCKRFIRICIPLWIFMIIDFIVEAILWKSFSMKYVFIYVFNLQGILGTNIGGTNLWFLTLIMLCYLITPLLQWIKQKSCNKKLGVVSIIIGIFLQIFFAYTTDIGMVAGHTLSWCMIAVGMYVAGYFVGNLILNEDIGKIRIIAITALAVVASVLVLSFKSRFDGQVIYDRLVIYYGMVVIDLWIRTVGYKLGQYVKDGVMNKIINYLDAISYEFYIVHGLIISVVTINVLPKFGSIAYILSTLVLSFAVTFVFHKVCDGVYKVIK